jgi:two-component system, chemotaxis family, sensor kinase CheA
MVDQNFKESFLSEAREHLDSLNDGVLNLEKNPTNDEYINQVFRACHTLKGNSAMMGYNLFSELAHKLENLLSKIRNKEMEATKEIIDILFEGIDLLEVGLDNIKDKDNEDIDIQDIIDRANEFVLGTSTIVKKEVKLDKIPSLFVPNDFQKLKIDEAFLKDQNIFRLVIIFNKESLMKAAKSQIIIKKIKNLMKDEIYCNPSFLDVEKGKINESIDLVIATEKSKEEVFDLINSVSETKGFVLGIEEEYIDENKKEIKKDNILSEIKPIEDNNPKKENIVKTYDKKIQSIKVDVKKLDSLVNLVGELLISNMRLKQVGKDIQSNNLVEVINNVDRLTLSIQDQVLQQRMVECGQIFSRYPRLVRDISAKLNKKINLIIDGADIELDRTVLDEIGEPLIHLLRNSMDHGIEDSKERLEKGKSEEGTIHLIAKRDKNLAIIEIKDDGKGIDLDSLIKKGIEKKLYTQQEVDLMDKKNIALFFRPGLSTKDKVSDLSGRGVGMDVVINKLKKIGGNVKIFSEFEKGTTIRLELPLTLAIISSLIVKVLDEKYAIPLSHILDTANISHSNIKTIQGNEVIIIRNEDIPIVRLDKYFGSASTIRDEYSLIITEREDSKVGFIVDEILIQQPILIKNLHPLLQGVKGIAGASILGDGKVCFILDVQNII